MLKFSSLEMHCNTILIICFSFKLKWKIDNAFKWLEIALVRSDYLICNVHIGNGNIFAIKWIDSMEIHQMAKYTLLVHYLLWPVVKHSH